MRTIGAPTHQNQHSHAFTYTNAIRILPSRVYPLVCKHNPWIVWTFVGNRY